MRESMSRLVTLVGTREPQCVVEDHGAEDGRMNVGPHLSLWDLDRQLASRRTVVPDRSSRPSQLHVLVVQTSPQNLGGVGGASLHEVASLAQKLGTHLDWRRAESIDVDHPAVSSLDGLTVARTRIPLCAELRPGPGRARLACPFESLVS